MWYCGWLVMAKWVYMVIFNNFMVFLCKLQFQYVWGLQLALTLSGVNYLYHSQSGSHVLCEGFKAMLERYGESLVYAWR